MAGKYWNRVCQIAWSETVKALHLNSTLGFLLWTASTATVLCGLFFWGSADASRDELLTRIFLAMAALGAIPVVFIWKFIGTPPNVHKELRGWVKELELVILGADETDEAVYGVGDRYSRGMGLVIDGADEQTLHSWETEFDTYIKEHFSAEYYLQLCAPVQPSISYTTIHEGSHRRTIRNVDPPDDRARIEHKLHNIKNWMGLAAGNYRGKLYYTLQLKAGDVRLYGLLEHRSPDGLLG